LQRWLASEVGEARRHKPMNTVSWPGLQLGLRELAYTLAWPRGLGIVGISGLLGGIGNMFNATMDARSWYAYQSASALPGPVREQLGMELCKLGGVRICIYEANQYSYKIKRCGAALQG
jgi:hypothetical protein